MPRRRKIQRERDLVILSERYLSGIPQYEIARQLKVTQQTVSNDLKELQSRWLASSLVNIDEVKARELAKIDYLERVYWEGYERSIRVEETTTVRASGAVRQVPGSDTQFIQEKDATTIKTQHSRDGNTSYLQGVQWCIDRRCKLLGIDAPTKLTATSIDGKTEVPIGVIVMIPDNGRNDR